MIPSRARADHAAQTCIDALVRFTCACPASRAQAIYRRRPNGTLARPLTGQEF